MIVFDQIIKELQSGGGVSVYFDNLISNHIEEYNDALLITYSDMHLNNSFQVLRNTKRVFERYRDCILPSSISGVFHSSYYRLPSTDIPVVTTVHDFIYEKYSSGPKQLVHSYQKNKAIRNSDLIICVSNNTALDLLEHVGCDEKKIRVIHNGYSNDYHNLGINNNSNVLFVGSRAGYKNFDLAVKAVSVFSELNLVIVGGGELSKFEVQLLNSYLPNRYNKKSYITNKDLNLLYNESFCLLYPSSYEGFGIPIIESMSAGCPVICVNTSSIPEVAGNAGMLIESPKLECIIEAIQELLNKSIRSNLLQLGFTQSEKFSWKKCYKETLSVYNELQMS